MSVSVRECLWELQDGDDEDLEHGKTAFGMGVRGGVRQGRKV